MTTFFLDCEFNGFGGELISMALVSASGSEWYAVLPIPTRLEPWVADNVIPIVNKPVKPQRMLSRQMFNASLYQFLSMFDDINVCADWYTDLAHFFESFAGRDHGSSYNLACQANLLKDVPELSPWLGKDDVRHNALSDARALMKWYTGPHLMANGCI